ncbi:WD40 repeat-like protein [Hesseltinella vesiculosa]|uniref:U3 small nucleolar RNA-associated protein 18 homolog n=1 Tax=Hesseltinella vesiculosa TaxID=101127 RepID=A0A1X2G7N1_9FUNG|nr:WD40 repeat-like protein [Hesseltinella vesiculosa]
MQSSGAASPEQADYQSASEGASDDDQSDHEPLYRRQPAWQDNDDAMLQISLKQTNRLRKLRKSEDEDIINGKEYEHRLRTQYIKMHALPSWAELPSEQSARKRKSADSDDDDDERWSEEDPVDDTVRRDLLNSTVGILEHRRNALMLSPDHLSIDRAKDANIMARSSDIIKSVQFHPNAQVLLTAGFDKTLRLFQIDGKVNHKIQSIRFKDLRIHKAQFHPSGDQIIVTGRSRAYYIYDVQAGKVERCPGIWGRKEKSLEKFSLSPCGRYMAFAGDNGNIIIVSYLTKQMIGSVRMNDVVTSMDWSSDGKYLYSSGMRGEIYQWDVAERSCLRQWIDDGSLGTTSLAVSPNEKYYAAGSSSGVVNIYDQSVLANNVTRPTPYKAVNNLTTSINCIKFNHDSQILAISSSLKKDQLKLVHVPSKRVFVNWPTERTPLGRVTCMDFSPTSEYLAIGNRRGKVLLYNIKDYAFH